MFSQKNALWILIGISTLGIIFHLFVLFQIIPYDIAWGGRLKSIQEMYVFEGFSIAISLFMIWIYWLKVKNVQNRMVNVLLWFFGIIFSLNTIGNLIAKTAFEKYFSIITLLSALLILRILVRKK